MKSLKPAHREKKRYLLIKGKDANAKNIEEAILEFIGIFGYSKSSPKIIKENKNKVILAINRESLNEIRASILMNKKNMEVVLVSGSIKKLKK